MPFQCDIVILKSNPGVVANSITVFQVSNNAMVNTKVTLDTVLTNVTKKVAIPTPLFNKPKSSYLKDMINLD